jgi:iron-sulfur cluster assembly accessory protein
MSLEPYSHINDVKDTVFEANLCGQANVVMDLASLELVSGSTINYTTKLIGGQFKIVDNPRAISNCGCGTSVDIKI